MSAQVMLFLYYNKMTDNLKGFHRVDVKDAVDFKGNPKS
jgi:hypothetical protein